MHVVLKSGVIVNTQQITFIQTENVIDPVNEDVVARVWFAEDHAIDLGRESLIILLDALNTRAGGLY